MRLLSLSSLLWRHWHRHELLLLLPTIPGKLSSIPIEVRIEVRVQVSKQVVHIIRIRLYHLRLLLLLQLLLPVTVVFDQPHRREFKRAVVVLSRSHGHGGFAFVCSAV